MDFFFNNCTLGKTTNLFYLARHGKFGDHMIKLNEYKYINATSIDRSDLKSNVKTDFLILNTTLYDPMQCFGSFSHLLNL